VSNFIKPDDSFYYNLIADYYLLLPGSVPTVGSFCAVTPQKSISCFLYSSKNLMIKFILVQYNPILYVPILEKNIYILSIPNEIVCPDLVVFRQQISLTDKIIIAFHPFWRRPRTGKESHRSIACAFSSINYRDLLLF